MKILRGHVLGVADKGEGDKRWALVGIQITSKDRDGFDITETIKLRVFGQQIKDGVHNSYRNLVGSEVFAPYQDEFDDKYKRISYSLAGLPLRLQEARPVQSSPSSSPVSVSAAAVAAKAV
ncbi:hypothetical protein [Azotobacter beijerinckii]|uniref:Single-strand binding protein family protein n=1 Tax=Azotobacter beijerinckii TaxID=170623 RepID=A0A1I1CUS0_9GAMM|nr:hypothetical protein [Azotobacter beijerinckii]SFB64163.1 hypothetical protein SAMN04244571_04644 [Azotobacter beijerinckii]